MRPTIQIEKIVYIAYRRLGTLLALSAVDRVNATEDLCGRSFSITAIGSLTTLTDTAEIKVHIYSTILLHTFCNTNNIRSFFIFSSTLL